MINLMVDITLMICLLVLLYWIWLTVKYLYAAVLWLCRWIWYRFLPVIDVKVNGVIVVRISKKEYDDMIKDWEIEMRRVENDI